MNILEQHIVLLHEWQELYLLTFNGNGVLIRGTVIQVYFDPERPVEPSR